MPISRLPVQPVQSIADELRALATRIEVGELGDCHNVAVVVDCDGGVVEVSLLGRSPLPGAHAHLLLGAGMRKLET